MPERDFDKDEIVDKYNLDREYELHPSTYMYWAEKAVDAYIEALKVEKVMKAVQTNVKKDLEKVRAEVDADVRKNWVAYGLDPEKKPTETAIAGAVIKSGRYKEADENCVDRIEEATDLWIEAVREEKMADERRRTMAFKKGSIEGLERLVLREYYPRFSQEVKDPLGKESKETIQSDLNKAMRRRRKR